MLNQLIATYTELMTSLATLPDEIALAQNDLTNAKAHKQDAERVLRNMDDDLIIAAGGWKAMGANDDERESCRMATFNVHVSPPPLTWKS